MTFCNWWQRNVNKGVGEGVGEGVRENQSCSCSV